MAGKINKNKFPRISRFIPEEIKKLFSTFQHEIQKRKITILFLFSTGFFLVLSVFLTLELFEDLQRVQEANLQEEYILSEISYWEDIVKEYPGFPDAHFRLAVLNFHLGRNQNARENVDKALKIDPGFEMAKELKKELY